MKAKRNNYGGVIALLLIGAAGVYAVGLYIKKTPEAAHIPAIERRVNPAEEHASKPAQTDTPQKQSSVKVLTPKSSGGQLSMEEATESVPDGTDPMVFAVNRFLENSHITPPRARALSIDLKDGIAYVSFNPAMQKSYGTSDEQAVLQGILKSLAQFPDVKKAQFEIDGKPMDSFGNVDLSEPLDVRDTGTTQGESTKQPGA